MILDPQIFHVGDLILQELTATGMTKAEFGRRLNISRQHVNTILQKDHLSVSYLVAISKVLQHDFLQYYVQMLPESISKRPRPVAEDPVRRTLLVVEIKVDMETLDYLEGLGMQK